MYKVYYFQVLLHDIILSLYAYWPFVQLDKVRKSILVANGTRYVVLAFRI